MGTVSAILTDLEYGSPHTPPPSYPFFFGAIQLLEVFPEYTDPFISAMYKFVPLANQMLRDGEGLEIWTNTRWEDFVMVLEW